MQRHAEKIVTYYPPRLVNCVVLSILASARFTNSSAAQIHAGQTVVAAALVVNCAVSDRGGGARIATYPRNTGSYRSNTDRQRSSRSSSPNGTRFNDYRGRNILKQERISHNRTIANSRAYRHSPYRYIPYSLQHYRQYEVATYPTYETIAPQYHRTGAMQNYRPYNPSAGSYPVTRVAYFGENSGDNKKGWLLLGAGQLNEAIADFAAATKANPYQAGPSLGYALARALSGEYDNSISVMRHALRVDPAGFSELTMDSTLEEPQQSLLYTYREGTPTGRDQAFMLAAVSYLLHDKSIAGPALAEATAYGDLSLSTHNLRQLIKSLD